MPSRYDYDDYEVQEAEPDGYSDDPCECGGRIAFFGMGDGTRLDQESFLWTCEDCGDADYC